MKNSIKLKAFFATVAIFVIAPVVAMGLQYLIQNLSAETLQMLFGGAVLAGLFYPVYQLMLMRFECNRILNETKTLGKK
jgi:hypothetical protein